MVDRLERLTDLVLFLREGRPKSLREIADSVPGYPEDGEARRQAFERDKRTLRGGGVEITTVPIGGKDQIGYLIRGEDFYLPDLELDADEQAALNLAVAGVHLGDPSGRDALWRLGLPAAAGAQPVAQLPAIPALAELHAALRAHATVSFSHRGQQRNVDPALLRFRGGWWYLVGLDRDRNAPRTFRVDRIEGLPVAGAPGTAHLPEDFDPSSELPDAPWKIGESEPVPVDILVDSTLAPLVTAELGDATLRERREEGSVIVRLEVTNVDALRNWVFELGDHAEVLGPPEVREELAGWLESMLTAQSDRATRSPKKKQKAQAESTSSTSSTVSTSAAGPSQKGRDFGGTTGGKVDAGRRLHRLLAVLTWLARRGRAPVKEVAERFGLSPDELVADLELAACCGLPPYTPDQLMEIIVDDTEVVTNLGAELARPRRLTAAEGFALAVAARAILSVRGSDPQGALSRALSKLESALGDTGSLRVDLGEPPHLEAARKALESGQQLELLYYSASSDEEALRVVDPLDVVAVDGRWYLDAYCHKANGMRRFRVDRITSLSTMGQSSEDHSGDLEDMAPTASAFVPGPDAVVATLAIGPEASWVLESVPVMSSSALRDGRTEVVLGVSSVVWFERLLLRLGPNAEVLSPPELVDAGRVAASRLLERYRPGGQLSAR